LAVTGAIQTGSIKQPALQPFAAQQQQALKDAFITSGNATELADGLGTKLGAVYQSLARYKSPRRFTNVSPAIANLFAYTDETTASDSNSAKYFLGNMTTNGRTAVSNAAAAILSASSGMTDVFGKTYGLLAGRTGTDSYGNSRPFQAEPSLSPITSPRLLWHAVR